jgi:hypothetical protein
MKNMMTMMKMIMKINENENENETENDDEINDDEEEEDDNDHDTTTMKATMVMMMMPVVMRMKMVIRMVMYGDVCWQPLFGTCCRCIREQKNRKQEVVGSSPVVLSVCLNFLFSDLALVLAL